ncbi:protein AMBP-like isoform X2 [Micropterus salmoides]|uniref:protein AMBP-like isoform X2 n=1 Tax=Micropterus salmoides TaxID=27706 RepID=UPI0018EAC1A1|nr:protein AMBP-like isoform X2 [Micropterus salmoides]
MQRALSLVSLLVLGSAWTLQAAHVLTEPLILTQENFDLGRFMGKWYEVAVVSTCPHYMQRKRGNPIIAALELQHVPCEDNFTMMGTSFRNGSCKQMSTVHGLTTTPGRFYHHVARFGADVDSFVVHSNYDEYAMMLLLSTEKPSGNKTTTVKLYSRNMNVRAAVLDDFKTLVRQHGLSDDTIIMNQNKEPPHLTFSPGECVPGEQGTKPITTQPQGGRPCGTLEKDDRHTNTYQTKIFSHC